MEKLNAFYCVFAAWSQNKELVSYDEFLFAENESAVRAMFEKAITKRFGGAWRETHSKHTFMIRDLTRIVNAMVKAKQNEPLIVEQQDGGPAQVTKTDHDHDDTSRATEAR